MARATERQAPGDLIRRAPASALAAWASAATAAALAGCGAGGERDPQPAATDTGAPAPRAPAPARPALCEGRLRVRATGRVTASAATELSGLVVSGARRDVLWTHNDSGDSARLLAVTSSGRTVAEVALTGAENVDWEDIALGPRGALLVGDIGDNRAARPSVVVYRVPEPRATSSAAVAAGYELRYADGARDAEALLFDRREGSIVIVTKSFGGEARVYVARSPSSRSATTLRRSGTIRLGAGEAVTAGDVSADGRTVVLRTYGGVYVWRRHQHETVAAALRRRPCRADADLLAEGQGEALAVTRDGRALITVPEGPRPQLRRYEASGGATRSAG